MFVLPLSIRSCLGLVFFFRIIFELKHLRYLDYFVVFHLIHFSVKNAFYLKKISNLKNCSLRIAWIFFAFHHVMVCPSSLSLLHSLIDRTVYLIWLHEDWHFVPKGSLTCQLMVLIMKMHSYLVNHCVLNCFHFWNLSYFEAPKSKETEHKDTEKNPNVNVIGILSFFLS